MSLTHEIAGHSSIKEGERTVPQTQSRKYGAQQGEENLQVSERSNPISVTNSTGNRRESLKKHTTEFHSMDLDYVLNEESS